MGYRCQSYQSYQSLSRGNYRPRLSPPAKNKHILLPFLLSFIINLYQGMRKAGKNQWQMTAAHKFEGKMYRMGSSRQFSGSYYNQEQHFIFFQLPIAISRYHLFFDGNSTKNFGIYLNLTPVPHYSFEDYFDMDLFERMSNCLTFLFHFSPLVPSGSPLLISEALEQKMTSPSSEVGFVDDMCQPGALNAARPNLLRNTEKCEEGTVVTELRFKYILHCKIKQEAKLEKKEGSVNSQSHCFKIRQQTGRYKEKMLLKMYSQRRWGGGESQHFQLF